MRILVLALLLGHLLPTSLWAQANQRQWIAVVAPAYIKAIEPLAAHRRTEGLKVVLLTPSEVLTAEEIRTGQGEKLASRVNQLCRDHSGPSTVLLVGCLRPPVGEKGIDRIVPALRGTAGRMKNEPSDNGYGDPDKNLLPRIAVGRFPAANLDEARAMVKKTLDFENNSQPGAWRTRLTILAGIPAFNPVVDRMVESQAMARFDRLDPVWNGNAIYHNPTSRFCVADRDLSQQAKDYLKQGQLFTFYFGHSGPEGLYGEQAHFLDRADWSQLSMGPGQGIFFTFGCLGCQMRGLNGEGYGLAAIRNPLGPVAVVGSHGTCFAAMVQLAAEALFEKAFLGSMPERLGDAWLALKGGLDHGKIDALTYSMLDAVDGDPLISQATQRREHLEMFTLLGDPALRLPAVPKEIRLTAPASLKAGQPLQVTGQLPGRLRDGKVLITLERGVSSVPTHLETLPDKRLNTLADRERVMNANHRKANRFILDRSEVEILNGSFSVRLSVPEECPWPRLILRAYATNKQGEALGVLTIPIQGAAKP